MSLSVFLQLKFLKVLENTQNKESSQVYYKAEEEAVCPAGLFASENVTR